MATSKNLTELKINYLTDDQYKNAVQNNRINDDEIYMTPSSSSDVQEFEGATTTKDGKRGLVPAPLQGNNNRFLAADGSWKTMPPATTDTNGLMTQTDKGRNEGEKLPLVSHRCKKNQKRL